MAATESARFARQRLAEETLAVIKRGSYLLSGTRYDIKDKVALSKQRTRYYAAESLLSTWATSSAPLTVSGSATTETSILEISTIDGACLLHTQSAAASAGIGILNFASAKKPGGGFLSGAQAQEESIARSSTLYPSLMTETGQGFYTPHKRDPKGGFYSHAMIYTPGVLLLRDDSGNWHAPLEVDVLTSAAVNAGVVRREGSGAEEKIAAAMRERMGRLLFLFEMRGVRNLVLGSFGTGVFKNKVATVAGIWRELLTDEGARFKHSFDRVVFAILGRATFDEFKQTFEGRAPDGEASSVEVQGDGSS